MIKTRGANGRASVTFTLTAAVQASHAAVCGEWNGWSADRDIMERADDGFTHTVELEAGRTYRFRYLLDGHRWENDWAADSYVPNNHGGDDSLVDLTALDGAVPAASVETSAKKAPVKKAAATKSPAKKAASAKKATASKAAPSKVAKKTTKKST